MHDIFHVESHMRNHIVGRVFDRFAFSLALSLWLLTMGSDGQTHVQHMAVQ